MLHQATVKSMDFGWTGLLLRLAQWVYGKMRPISLETSNKVAQ